MLTYETIAERYDVRLCDGCDKPLNHQFGSVEASIRLVHWTPRRIHRRGIYRLLRLIAQTRVLRYEQMPDYEQAWASHTWARSAAHDLHLKFPAHWANAAKASALWRMSQEQAAHPNLKVNPAVRRWASRRTT